MSHRVVSFSPPDISETEIAEVCEALRSGWITTGPRVKELEKRIAEYIGVGCCETGLPRCVCLNSQTACAEMALRLLGIGAGDEVIVPAYTYTATASVVCHVGAMPVLCDSRADSIQMDYDALERLISPRTKAVIPVDVAGIPCDYERIYSIAESKKDMFVPEGKLQEALGRIAICADTAHAFGAERLGVKCGNIADFSSFSFHAVKNLTTAEGGALTWRHIDGIEDGELYRQLQLFSLHGQSKDAFSKVQKGAWEYDIAGPWYKCNMTDIMAAIGLGQLERYPAMLAKRRRIIGAYNSAFEGTDIEYLPHYTDEYASSGHLYITRIKGIDDAARRRIITAMAEKDISCNVHYKPLPMFTAYKKLGYDIKNFPNAYRLYENEITLPLHTCLTDEDVEYVTNTFTEITKDIK